MNIPAPPPPRVLVADDERDLRWVVGTLLRQEGIEPIEVDTGRAAVRRLGQQPTVDALLVDLRMPGCDGLEVLSQARKLAPEMPVIVMTGFGSIPSAVEAIKRGAFGYITKPFDNDTLIGAIRQALASRRGRSDRDLELAEVMGNSPAMQRLFAGIDRVAPTDFTVVLQGETGTGKELVARAIHRRSRRAGGPFVPIDCGSIPPSLIESELFGHEKGEFTGADRSQPGCFEVAQGGTLFLDEISNLPLLMQAKLLRALQERQVRRVGSTTPVDLEVRVVAATNLDLGTLVESGRFRRDLYHRLNEFRLVLPALRERGEDVLYLARRFQEQTSEELGKHSLEFTPEAVAKLRAYSWPGNVRELRNMIRRATLLADERIEAEHLEVELPPSALPSEPEESAPVLDGSMSLREIMQRHWRVTEREIVLQALRQTRGNKAQAARLLQVDYKTIRTKAKEYGYRPAHPGEDDDATA